MNCPKCGSFLPQGAQFCNVCNEPLVTTGYVPYGQPPAGYPQQGYAQSYPPQGQNPQGYPSTAAYPQQTPSQGYAPQYGQQQGYPSMHPQSFGGYYAQPPPRREPGAFVSAIALLPRMFLESMRDPGAVLQSMMERHDVYTAPVVSALSLLLSFLCAMVVTHEMIGMLFGLLSSLPGVSLAGDAAGLSQGVSYISGKIAPSIGGVVVLCQLIAMIIPLLVALIYLCAVRKVRFSWELLCGFATLTTLPSIVGTFLCMLLSLITPMLALIMTTVNMAAGLVVMVSLLGRVTGRMDQQPVSVKLFCVSLSVFITLLLLLLVGGALMNGVATSMTALMENIGSLL